MYLCVYTYTYIYYCMCDLIINNRKTEVRQPFSSGRRTHSLKFDDVACIIFSFLNAWVYGFIWVYRRCDHVHKHKYKHTQKKL